MLSSTSLPIQDCVSSFFSSAAGIRSLSHNGDAPAYRLPRGFSKLLPSLLPTPNFGCCWDGATGTREDGQAAVENWLLALRSRLRREAACDTSSFAHGTRIRRIRDRSQVGHHRLDFRHG